MKKAISKKIGEIKFSLISPEQIKKLSVAKVVTPELYDIDGYPVDGGLMDLRLGAIDPGVRCRTCGGRIKECLGHPGVIDLAKSVIHLKYVPLIELGLRSFCQSCGKLMLDDKDMEKYLPSERAKKAKDQKRCPHCQEEQEKVKLDKPSSFYQGKTRIFPTQVRERLANIPDDELKKIGIDPTSCRPEHAILTSLLVPPVTVRPSIILETGERSEDDLTHKLSDIIRANQRLWENLNAGAPEVIIEDLWDLLQYHITTFFDNSVARVPPARHRSGQPLKTITERIKGKEGRIRKNIAGKRVNYSGRTVITPDPNIKINEVGIPFEIARVVTVAETVNDINKDKLSKLIRSGTTWPGANYVIRPDGRKKKVTKELVEELIEEITPGYQVERHLQDGDVVLFNRHPSLHRASLMAHFVRVLPGRTFRMHPAVALPYNADYDGDEMNIHSPQTEEARAEARELLDVKKNVFSPKNNMNFVGCIVDAVTGNYVLGKSTFTKEEANQLLYQSGIDAEVTKKTVSGTELFSMLLPKINHINDTVEIKDGKIISGEVNDSLLGSEGGELVKVIDRDHGRDVAFDTVMKAFNLGKNFLSARGLSLSVEDFDLDPSVRARGDKIIKDVEKKIDQILEEYTQGKTELFPGKTAEESREIHILKELNEIRTKLGDIIKKEFPDNNPVNDMIKSGGGGKLMYIGQMASSVGQQALGGGRIDFGYTGRTLSFFKKGDLSPKARGFIKSPFIRGLRPDEFFFQAITGRDGMMDTGLKTPKSGYLYRRLASAFQDIRAEYDGTVRDGGNNVIQFKYGDDGKDVTKLHLKDATVAPGEAVGLVTAQSFGEASTQMVLNTFHLAGVAEMQVTTGLPRIIEICDARKKPSTPKMEIFLEKEHNTEDGARVFAEKIKEVKVKEIASSVNLDFGNKEIEITIDKEGLRRTHTTIKKLVERLNELGYNVEEAASSIKLNASDYSFREIYKLKEKLKDTIISGIKGIEQILIVKRGKDFVIVTLGTNLKEVIKMVEVDTRRVVSNDIHEVSGIFGIEAARQLIIEEIKAVRDSQGLEINDRHLKLVSDSMTNTGDVKGVTRMGIIAQKASILARATFETPVKQFVNAIVKGSTDKLESVIENIILNQPVPVGTGLPGLMVNVIGSLKKGYKDLEVADSKIVKEAIN
ncbi:MAG: DNA-directed RNA polymerase subunit A' [Nanoarchaeota archaeon]|jgi:DNA-directed RNA polymerase subunit A'|nr:DNA-directed RNA polymerase subunit A' [Nanoarchaeota archaeon]